MESELHQSQSHTTPEGRMEPQLKPAQISRAQSKGEWDLPKPQDAVEQSQSVNPNSTMNSIVPVTATEAGKQAQKPAFVQSEDEVVFKHVSPEGLDHISMETDKEPSSGVQSQHNSNSIDEIPNMKTNDFPPRLEMDATIVMTAEQTAMSGLDPGKLDSNRESEFDRGKDQMSTALDSCQSLYSTFGEARKTNQTESNTVQTLLDSKSSSELKQYGDISEQHSSLGITEPCQAGMESYENLGGDANPKPSLNYSGVVIDETDITEKILCDKSSSNDKPSTAGTHHEDLLNTPSVTGTQHHPSSPNTSLATGSQDIIQTRATAGTRYQNLLNTPSAKGTEYLLSSPNTASETRSRHHQNLPNTFSADVISKDLPQHDNSKESMVTDIDALQNGSFPNINQTENNFQTVTNLGEVEDFQLPPLPEINSTVTSTDPLKDIQQPFVSLVKLDDKMLSVPNMETLIKKATNSQSCSKGNKSQSWSKSNQAQKNSFTAIQKKNSWNAGYQQILDVCDQHFPPKINLIQDLINLSHEISEESGIKENFSNICNQLMSEILHLNLTLTNICKSAIDTGNSNEGQETPQRELPIKGSLSKESPLAQTFDSLLNVWKQNMKQRQLTGKLSFEDAELAKMDKKSPMFPSDADSTTQISVGDIERQWHARFPSSGSHPRLTASPKSKPRSRKSTERVYIEKDDDEEDDDYIPSKSQRSKQKQESESEQDFGRSLRSRRNMLKKYSEELYHDGGSLDSENDGDNSISDTEQPLDKSDGEYIPSDEDEISGKIECDICDMAFKTQDMLYKHNNIIHDKQIYTCNICDKSFPIKIALDNHLRNHGIIQKTKTPSAKVTKSPDPVTDAYECQECGVKFLQKFRLAIHMRIHTNNKFRCELCNQGFNHQKTLDKHRADKHLIQKQLDCQQCGRTFRSATSLRFHMMKHKGILPFACKICEKKFTNQSTCNSHERTHSDVKSFSCEECDKGFGTRAALKRHKLLHGQEKNFQCDLCGQQFRQKSTLVSHRRTHTGEKPYVCDICGKAFTQSSILNMHKRVHTGYKPHKCTECDSSFSCRASLRKHMTIHTGEKNFMCKVCGRRFARAQGLKYHEISHTGVKPYQCKECGKRFTCRKHVKRHQLLHSGEMPFSCSVCGKLFRQEQNMKVHMRIHSGDKPFQCTNCGRCFAYKQSLQQHNMRCVVSAIYLPLQQQASVSMTPSTH